MVAEELDRDAHEDRLDDLVAFRHSDDVVDHVLGEVAVFGCHADDLALAGFDFLHVSETLLEDFARGGEEDARAILADERDRAVLHFSGRITFGVDVGNFLELECAFESNREHQLGGPKGVKRKI